MGITRGAVEDAMLRTVLPRNKEAVVNRSSREALPALLVVRLIIVCF